MIHAISFNGNQTVPVETKTADIKNNSTNVFRMSTEALATTQKVLYGTKEGITGGLVALTSGAATGAAVMSVDWILQKCLGKGLKSQPVLTTPIKTACNFLTGLIEKATKVFSKDTSFRKVISYPVIGFPKDIYKYVSSAKGCSKIGKGIAVVSGLAVAGFAVCKTIIKINRINADIDHGFKTGHNS